MLKCAWNKKIDLEDSCLVIFLYIVNYRKCLESLFALFWFGYILYLLMTVDDSKDSVDLREY
jgi:hypothetical protein